MAQLLAIEWDAREARVAVGRMRGKELTVERAFAVRLATAGDAGSAPEAPAGARIADVLASLGLGRMDTLVAIGRTNIELRQLTVPPAPPDELPEIVRFQALRQFTTIGEDWPLDFVPLGAGEGESVNVLAAAISPEVVEQIRSTCVASHLVPKRIVLRPFGAASLLRRHDRGAAQPCRLMVDLLAEEADLSVLDGEHLLLTRTVRLAAVDDREALARGLLGEIRRTIAAANNQLGGRRVEKVILCGDGTEHDAIRKLVEQELSLEVELFDPFSEVRLEGELRDERPPQSGRFAPLLGLLLDEATGTPHALDFLHPRKKPEQTDQRRRKLLIAATAAVACLAALFLIWVQLSSLDDEIQAIRVQSAGMKKKLDEAKKWGKEAGVVQEFLDHDFNWLDEMEWLSVNLPGAEDVILSDISFKATPPEGGALDIAGFMRQPDQFKDIEDRLRVDDRVVKAGAKPPTPDLKRDTHKYGFKETVRVPAGPREPKKVSNPAAPVGSTAAAKLNMASVSDPQSEASDTAGSGDAAAAKTGEQAGNDPPTESRADRNPDASSGKGEEGSNRRGIPSRQKGGPRR
jgi:Tfp pilus assembly PilM family ATPase